MVRTLTAAEASGCTIAPPVPGGVARHYRVQRFEAVSSIWRLVHVFPSRDSAEACLRECAGRGQAVRLVRYGRCPSAS